MWQLSASKSTQKELPNIEYIDKVVHFVYFFCGSVMLTNWFYFKHPHFLGIKRVLFITAVGSLIGIIDEYHQSFIPGRSGNDLGDWLADTCGAFIGAICMIYLLNIIAPHKEH